MVPSWARVKKACPTASWTSAVLIEVPTRQPTIRRLKASMTNAT